MTTFREKFNNDNNRLKSLARALENSWKEVAGEMGIGSCINITNADQFLKLLIVQGCTIQEFKQALVNLELIEELSYLRDPECMTVLKQPYAVKNDSVIIEDRRVYVKANKSLQLKIETTGAPMPTCEWFLDNIVVGKGHLLNINEFRKENEGQYYCRLKQIEEIGGFRTREILSDDIEACIWLEPPKIIKIDPPQSQIKSQIISIECGQLLRLAVHTSEDSIPTFFWTQKGIPLEEQNSNILSINNVNLNHSGTYECSIRNNAGEALVKFEVKVKERPKAKQKKAFIVGNKRYTSLTPLDTPENDADILSSVLQRKYNFNCEHIYKNIKSSKLREHFTNFCKEIETGAYVVFYFGGHGARINRVGSCIMMGIDAKANGKPDDDIFLDDEVLNGILKRKPAILVIMLDACQINVEQCFPPNYLPPQKDDNVIQFYATSMNRNALEGGGAGNNSVFVKHLIPVMENDIDMTIDDLMRQVLGSIQEEQRNRVCKPEERQVPECTYTHATEFRFSDSFASGK